MRRNANVTVRMIRGAATHVRARGVRRALRTLERREPDLAEYVMEMSTDIYARLDRACESHRAVRSIHEEMVLMVLVSIEAVRRST